MFHILSSCSWLSSKAFYLLLILSNDQLPAVATSSIRLSIAAHTILPIRYWQSSQIQQGTHTFERNRIPKPQWSTVFEIRGKPFKGPLAPLNSVHIKNSFRYKGKGLGSYVVTREWAWSTSTTFSETLKAACNTYSAMPDPNKLAGKEMAPCPSWFASAPSTAIW